MLKLLKAQFTQDAIDALGLALRVNVPQIVERPDGNELRWRHYTTAIGGHLRNLP